jgi:hypothetical protein
MDIKPNLTLEDILKEEDDDIDPNVQLSLDEIINEPDDDVTEKIIQTLKENLPHPSNARKDDENVKQIPTSHPQSTVQQSDEKASQKKLDSNPPSNLISIVKGIISNIRLECDILL